MTCSILANQWADKRKFRSEDFMPPVWKAKVKPKLERADLKNLFLGIFSCFGNKIVRKDTR